MLEYVSIAMLAVLILAVIVLIAIVVTKKEKKPDDASYGHLEARIESQEKNINQKIELVFAEKMALLGKELREENDKANSQLSSFQKTIGGAVSDSIMAMNKFLNERVDKMNETLSGRVGELTAKINENLLAINKKVGDSLQSGFKQNAEAMGDVRARLEKIDAAQKNLDSLQKEVVSLNGILSNNQSRGQYGELQLEMLLESTFPGGKGKYYELQDDLGEGNDGNRIRPDATIVFQASSGKIKLAIDSKFPLADYRRLFESNGLGEEEKATLSKKFKQAVKARIEEVASKYIVLGKTVDSAVAFIPSDGVYAYIASRYPDLMSQARSEHVIVACPSTIQAVIVLFHNAAIDAERNRNLEVINDELQRLGVEFGRFTARWDALSKSISALGNKSEDLGKTVKKLGSQFDRISKNQIKAPESEAIDYEGENPLLAGDAADE